MITLHVHVYVHCTHCPHRLDSQASDSPLCQQEGVFRVNCMDCLDRTNVIESVYAREVLQTVVCSHTLHK